MSKWLFDSRGRPVVFVNDDKVFTRTGRYVGRLEGTEVWHGSYKGEIFLDDRFIFNPRKTNVTRGTPGVPGIPGIPGVPGSKGSISLPAGYRDVEFD